MSADDGHGEKLMLNAICNSPRPSPQVAAFKQVRRTDHEPSSRRNVTRRASARVSEQIHALCKRGLPERLGGKEVRDADRFDLALKLLVGGKTNEPVPRSDADLLPVEYWVATMPHVELAAAQKRHELNEASSPEARGDDARPVEYAAC